MKINRPDVCAECGGFCCLYSLRNIPVAQLDATHKEFFDAKSVDVKLIDDRCLYVLNQKCPHHTEKGCDMSYEERPAVCREFPPRLDDEWVHFCPLMRKIYK